jgi:O-antigen ligase
MSSRRLSASAAGVAPPSALTGPARRNPQRGINASLPLLHLYFVWALTLFDFQFFLGNVVASPLIYVLYLGYPPLLLMMAIQGPMIMVMAKRWMWFPAMFALLAIAVMTVPIADNKQLARQAAQYLLIYYVIALGTAVYVRTAMQAVPIVVMLIGHFAWYGLFARTSGLVPWHPTLANYDGFGSLMVMGVAICYWFAVAARHRIVKLLIYLLAVYCVLGVVASFARAAFLSLVVLVGWMWIRSPRKLLTGAGILAAALVIVAGASLIFEPGFFYSEIMSAFEEGASEGTGQQRWELWKVGFRVWLMRPILGVGGGNFGAFAAGHFRVGELEAFPNPGQLYGFNLHNAYMQILSEFGTLGIVAFGLTLWDFWKKNRAMRERAAGLAWDQRTGGRFELRYMALGLEAATIANLLSGMFYASLFAPFFYTVWVANRMLWAVSRPDAPQRTGSSPPRRLPPWARLRPR